MASDVYKKLNDEHNKTKSRFIGYYSGNATSLIGDSVLETIKYFYNHYNAILSAVVDFEESIVYIGKENEEPDVRGYYNYSYYNKTTNECIYNRDEATRPLTKVKPSKMTKLSQHGYISRDGKYYGCGFEGHRWLADELFLTNTLPLKESDKHRQRSIILDNLGWVKISSKRIHYLQWNENDKKLHLTVAQKKAIEKWLNTMGGENYEYQYDMQSKSEILEELYGKD